MVRLGWTCFAMLVSAALCAAQNLPDAPSAAAVREHGLSFATAPARAAQPTEPAEIPASSHLSDSEKFQVFVSHAHSPLTFAGAGVMRSRNSEGWNWPRSYTAALAERESNAFFGRYLFPMLLDQDPRYHPAESEKFMPRAVYAASRVLITRKDDGSKTLNTSYLLGTLLTSSLANAYKHPWDRTAGDTFGDVGATIGGDAGFNLMREFWPQLREKISTHTPKPLKKLGEKFSDNDDDPLKTEAKR